MTLTAQEFAFISGLVRRDAAIVLEAGKEYLVEARLLPLARQSGLPTVSEFVNRAQQRPEPEIHAKIVDALTTNETSFFRDGEPFKQIVDTVLPDLLRRRSASRTIKVWSAASSSGQEPYTLAMVLQDHLPGGWTFDILGTDISTEMLTRAEAGQYTQLEVNRGLPAPLLVKHFERAGAHWKVAQALRKNVTFRRLNLAAPFPPVGPFDIVFIRNVLIYFDVQTKRNVLQRVAGALRPDGWLFLGSAETTIGIDDRFERVVAGRTSAYKLRAAGWAATPVSAVGKG
ncbi:CheR family methyltransferase [Dactylosporangium sp. CA-092794]|uniref:CheR family methyltransferase n=1 Tax=Dactylosporangium sp. CA-092794 TaxID=3239929 RepID=UPI003D91C269